MIRKLSLAVAVVALGFVVAAPVQAGGSGSGAKKSSTIRVKNISNASVAVFPVPTGTDPTESYVTANTKQIPVSGIGNFPVAPGTGTMVAAWSTAFFAPPFASDTINFPAAVKKAGQKGYCQTSGDIENDEAPTISIGGGPF